MQHGTTSAGLAAVLAVTLARCGNDTDNAAHRSSTLTPAARSTPSATSDLGRLAKGETVDGSRFAETLSRAISAATSYREYDPDQTSPGMTGRSILVKKVSRTRTDSQIADGGLEGACLIDNLAYLPGSLFDAPSPGADSASTGNWVRVDPHNADITVAAVMLTLTVDGKPNAVTLGLLNALDGHKVTFVGRDGKGAHFSATVAGADFDAALAKATTGQLRATIERDTSSTRGERMSYDIWVDDAGRPAEISTESTSLPGRPPVHRSPPARRGVADPVVAWPADSAGRP